MTRHDQDRRQREPRDEQRDDEPNRQDDDDNRRVCAAAVHVGEARTRSDLPCRCLARQLTRRPLHSTGRARWHRRAGCLRRRLDRGARHHLDAVLVGRTTRSAGSRPSGGHPLVDDGRLRHLRRRPAHLFVRPPIDGGGLGLGHAAMTGVATLAVAAAPLDHSDAIDTLHGACATFGYVTLAATPLLAARPLEQRDIIDSRGSVSSPASRRPSRSHCRRHRLRPACSNGSGSPSAICGSWRRPSRSRRDACAAAPSVVERRTPVSRRSRRRCRTRR